MDTRIFCFLKFGSKDNIRDLYENGTVYCNPVQYFRELEDGRLRGDSYEGISRITNYPPGTFRISVAGKEIDRDFEYINLHLKHAYETVLGNIYSLYCVASTNIGEQSPFRIDQRCAEFGTHFLLIKNNPLFLSRVEKALRNQKLKFRHGFVRYYDCYRHNGPVDLFQKSNDFAFQNEFRFYIQRKATDPLILNIGSLRGMAEIYDAEALNTFEIWKKPRPESSSALAV